MMMMMMMLMMTMMMMRRRRRRRRKRWRRTTTSRATFSYNARLKYLLEHTEFLQAIFAPCHSVILLAD
jgi:hypothetical protein